MPITSKEIREKLQSRNNDGFSTFTLPQIQKDVETNDSFIGEKLNKAVSMGISREQALNYFAHGDVKGDPKNRDKGFFEKVQGGFKKANESIVRRGVEMGGQLERIAGDDGRLGVFDIPEVVLGLTTQTYGGLFEAGIHSGLGVASAVTPDFIEDPVIQGFAGGLTALMNAPVVSDAIAGWDDFKSQHPRLAFNVGGIAEVGIDIATGAAGISAAKKLGKSVVKGGSNVASVAGDAAQATSKIIPSKAGIADTLLNEALGFNSNQVRNLSRPNVLGTDPVTWLKSRGIIGTRETVLDQLDRLADKAEELVDDIVVSIPGRSVNEGTEMMVDQLLDVVGKADSATKGAFRGLIEELSDLRRFPEKTVAQHQRVKKIGAKILRMYSSKTGSPLDNLTAEGLRDTYAKVQHYIEGQAKKVGKDVSRYNKDVQGAIEISKVLDFTGGLAPYTRLMPFLKNAGRTGFAALAGFSLGGPAGAAAVAIIERLFEIPSVKIFFARKLMTLPPSEIDTVIKAIQAGKPTSQSRRIMQGISDDLMDLLQRPGGERIGVFPESLSPNFMKDVHKAIDDAIDSVLGEDRVIRRAPEGSQVARPAAQQIQGTSPTTLPPSTPPVNPLELPRNGASTEGINKPDFYEQVRYGKNLDKVNKMKQEMVSLRPDLESASPSPAAISRYNELGKQIEALTSKDLRGKPQSVNVDDFANLTPEERATGLIGGSDNMPFDSQATKFAKDKALVSEQLKVDMAASDKVSAKNFLAKFENTTGKSKDIKLPLPESRVYKTTQGEWKAVDMDGYRSPEFFKTKSSALDYLKKSDARIENDLLSKNISVEWIDQPIDPKIVDIVSAKFPLPSVGGVPKTLEPLAKEAFDPSTAYLQRNISMLNDNGIRVKSPDDIVTLYHGTKADAVSSIEKNGFNPGSFFATDKNATRLFAGEKGKILTIKVPVKDMGFVMPGTMAGSKGVSIQTVDRLAKGSDGIYRIAK